jgi:hypothetical protein
LYVVLLVFIILPSTDDDSSSINLTSIQGTISSQHRILWKNLRDLVDYFEKLGFKVDFQHVALLDTAEHTRGFNWSTEKDADERFSKNAVKLSKFYLFVETPRKRAGSAPSSSCFSAEAVGTSPAAQDDTGLLKPKKAKSDRSCCDEKAACKCKHAKLCKCKPQCQCGKCACRVAKRCSVSQ